MAALLNPADVQRAMRELVTAQKTNLGVEVTVPVAYADGEMVSVVVEARDGDYAVHDAGFSAMRLSLSGIALTRHVSLRLNELANRYRCSFVDGRVFSHSAADSLPVTICLVANAARSVADYAFEVRRQIESDFRVTVADQLKEIAGKRVRENEEFKGKSGTRYRVHAIVLDSTEARPEHFVSALAHRNVVPRNVAMFYDLHGSYPAVENDAVVDDTGDFRDEDRALLGSVSTVIGLMQAPHQFRRIIDHA